MAQQGLQSAVRKLTITALRSRALTLPHVSLVAAAIGHGIDASDRARSADSAYDGLREALDEALLAVEIALGEFIAGGGRLSKSVLDDWLRAAQSLPRVAGRGIEARVRALSLALDTAGGDIDGDGERVLGLLASGALLGLLASQVRSTAAPSKAPRRKSSSARLASDRS